MFFTRLISGIILLLMAFFFVGSGGAALFGISVLISLIGMFELYRALKIEKKWISYIGYAAALIYYLLIYFNAELYLALLIISTLLILMTVYVFSFPRFKTEEISLVFFGMFYVAVLFSYLFRTRMIADGRYLVWLIFLSSWGSDTCAYAVGMLIGKHKIAPKLSPKKSIEGCLGGVLGAAALGFIFAAVFRMHMQEVENPQLVCALASAIGSVISQIGDFAASAIKRNHEIKDYGNLIPGHGGILDRFDSMLFTAPAVFFALKFLI
ncbi:MAG: phosphatidate cytidylyltransferase [Johnsonella sp.]|nr:phosphatidate cytidylyltransferase [Johnsonella sp.]